MPKREFSKNDYYFYLACFSSTIFDKLLSVYAKQLAGGSWYDLGANYTNKIPLPNVSKADLRSSKAYQKLAELGIELNKGNSFVKPIINEFLGTYFYPSTNSL